MSVSVECKQIVHKFGQRVVLQGIDWRIDAGDSVGLVGASGAGKTTLLRIIAGLDRCTSGRVLFATDGGANAAPRIGLVFQNLGLWPHMTALDHLQCVPQPGGQQSKGQRAEALLAEVQLDEAAWRLRPAQLSGGEAQRLALARSLAGDPQLLLLDEPLAQLDAALRDDLLALIGRIARERGMTVVCVTHSWADVAQLCARAAVLVDGRLEQAGEIGEVYFRPRSAAVARLTGPTVVLSRTLFEQNYVDGARKAPALLADGNAYIVRPQQLRLAAPAGPNSWSVVGCEPRGHGWLVSVQCGAEKLTLPAAMRLAVGESVGVAVDSDAAL